MTHPLLSARYHDIVVVGGVVSSVHLVGLYSRHIPVLPVHGGNWRDGCREKTDHLQGSPDKSPGADAEGLHLFNNVIRFSTKGCLLGG